MNKKTEATEQLDLLTPQEVCKILGGITQKTLREWNINHRYKKTLSPIRFTHKVVRYERKNIIEFINKCKGKY